MRKYKNIQQVPLSKERHFKPSTSSFQDFARLSSTYSAIPDDYYVPRRRDEALNFRLNKFRDISFTPPPSSYGIKLVNKSSKELLFQSKFYDPALEELNKFRKELLLLPTPTLRKFSFASLHQDRHQPSPVSPSFPGYNFKRHQQQQYNAGNYLKLPEKRSQPLAIEELPPPFLLNDNALLKISRGVTKNHVDVVSKSQKIVEKSYRNSSPRCLLNQRENTCDTIKSRLWPYKPNFVGNNSRSRKTKETTTLPISTPTQRFHPSSSPAIKNYFCGGSCSVLLTTMKGKGNRNSSASSHQVANSGGTPTVTPRTPGTPSDAALTSNPSTPGNNSSSSMVSSSPQYVAITVEAGSSAANGIELRNGGNTSYVGYVEGSSEHSNTIYNAVVTTDANGQNMSYPMYSDVNGGGSAGVGNCENSGTTYNPGSNAASQYFPGGSANEVTYVQEGDVYMIQSPGSTNNNNNNIVATDSGTGTSSLSNRVSPATKRKKSVPELCPIYPQSSSSSSTGMMIGPPIPIGQRYHTGNHHRRSRHHQQQLHEMCYNDHDGSYLMEENDLTEPASSYHQSGSSSGTAPLVPELDTFGFHNNNSMNSVSPSSAEIEALYDSTGDDHLLYSANNVNPALRTNPVTVQWLLENYETAEGVSLPRSTLYNHYLRHCTDHKLEPVNAASFGKLIRSVFLGLRTRRLGTRGNSKYHYYGIRLKPSSPLNHLSEENFMINGNYASNGHHNSSAGNSPHKGGAGGNANKRLKSGISRNDGGEGGMGNGLGDASAFLQYLGEFNGSLLDEFPEFNLRDEHYPDGITENDLFVFRTLYREHCKTMLESLLSFQLSAFEENWKLFWRGNDDAALMDTSDDYEKILPKSKMLLICKMKGVQEFVKVVDYSLYQSVVEMLLPDVLNTIPSGMTQAIRNFAKLLETWVTTSMTGYPEAIVAIRLTAVNALAQTLRRYTSLNHLAQAARAVLQNQTQITQMLADLNRVDFQNVEEQASWVCGCGESTVPSLEQDFKATLSQQQTLDEWAAWLEKVVDKIVKPHENSSNFVTIARNFLLKWSFYSSLIIRDLTLRSAASFGSFHLLRLLYDEYIFYVVEHRVAKVTGVNPIQVIGKKTPDIPFAMPVLTSSQQQLPLLQPAPVQCQRINSEKITRANGIGTGASAAVNIPNTNQLQSQHSLIVAVKSEPPSIPPRRTNRNFLTS